MEKLLEGEHIFVIYYDGGMDDAWSLLGYIKGSEEDAIKCLEKYAETNRVYNIDDLSYQVLENLAD